MQKIEARKTTVFVEKSIKINGEFFSGIHKHSFGEIHIIEKGQITITVGNKSYPVCEGEAIFIPKDTLHTVRTDVSPLEHIAFLIDTEYGNVQSKKISENIISELFEILKKDGESEEIYKFFVFVFNTLCHDDAFVFSQMVDYEILISEFFNYNYYKDVSLGDLADLLHVTKTHAQRLTKSCTGMTFGENLLLQRMRTADELIKLGNMSMEHISTRVGYSTYSGFYKAYKKYKEKELIDSEKC